MYHNNVWLMLGVLVYFKLNIAPHSRKAPRALPGNAVMLLGLLMYRESRSGRMISAYSKVDIAYGCRLGVIDACIWNQSFIG